MSKRDIEKDEIIEKNTKAASKDIFLEYAPYVIIIFFVVIIRVFVATPVKVNGTSMYPTLRNGDTMILYKLTKRMRGIKRFDIVVIDTDSGKLIKRVIGLPGDKIHYEVKKNENDEQIATLYVNGEEVKEDFLVHENAIETCYKDWDICEGEVEVPKGEYYVMGDNRHNSRDSRMIGTVKDEVVMGTTEIILFPLNRFGKVE